MNTGASDELQALQEMVNAMARLDLPAQLRAVSYLADRFLGWKDLWARQANLPKIVPQSQREV